MRKFILAFDGMLRCPPGGIARPRVTNTARSHAPTRRTEVGHAPDCMRRESVLGTEPCSRWLDLLECESPPPHRCMMLTAEALLGVLTVPTLY